MNNVIRGGSWIDPGSDTRIASRCRTMLSERKNDLGLRLILDAPPPAKLCGVRGGSWLNPASATRGASDFRFIAAYRDLTLGFRLILRGGANVS